MKRSPIVAVAALIAACGPAQPVAQSLSNPSTAPTDAPTSSASETPDALLARGGEAWANREDQASHDAFFRAGRALALRGKGPNERWSLGVALATSAPIAVGDSLIVPVCLEGATGCAVLEIAIAAAKTTDAYQPPRRSWIKRTLQSSDKPFHLGKGRGDAFIAYNERGTWLFPTLDQSIDLGRADEVDVGPGDRAAMVVKGALRVIDLTTGKDVLSAPTAAQRFGYIDWPKDGAWLAQCDRVARGPTFVIDAETGTPLFHEADTAECVLDVANGSVVFARATDPAPTLRSWSLSEQKEQASTNVAGAQLIFDVELVVDAPSHVVTAMNSTATFGNYDTRTLKPSAAPKPMPASANPLDGLPVGPSLDARFPDTKPFAQFATPKHKLLESYAARQGTGLVWSGGRSPNGQSALLLEDLAGTTSAHDRAVLILDTASMKVRARVPIVPADTSGGDWQMAVFADNHTILARWDGDAFAIDADLGSVLLSFAMPDDIRADPPVLMPNGILVQTGGPGLLLFDLGETRRPSTEAPWVVRSWLAPPAHVEKGADATRIKTRDGDVSISPAGFSSTSSNRSSIPPGDIGSDTPDWIVCRVGDSIYTKAVCDGVASLGTPPP